MLCESGSDFSTATQKKARGAGVIIGNMFRVCRLFGPSRRTAALTIGDFTLSMAHSSWTEEKIDIVVATADS